MYEHDFCEYAVARKKEGKYLASICLAVLCAALFAVCFVLYGMPRLGGKVSFLVIAAFLALLWYLSRYTFTEYEYTQTCALFDGAAVYDRKYRREKVSVDLKTATSIAPFKGNFPGGASPRAVVDLRSSASAPNAYAIVYNDEKGVCRAVLFDANKTIIDNIYHHVPSVTVRSDGLPE